MTRYRLDPGHSRFTVHGIATGLLSVFAHSPTFAVRDFQGELRWDPGDANGALEVRVAAGSLQLIDKVRPADREEIERRMRQEVLETAAFPDIRFQSEEMTSEKLGPDKVRVRVAGRLTVHGVSAREMIPMTWTLYSDGIRLVGEFPLRMSSYQIRPVTALGGAIQLRDQLQVAFDIVSLKEGA